ncbi:hypothetical protein [Vibrio harveyi]|uniref:hypothetical protein n=1 Tax=Vibrio harveyi TaxID=669 RepID=UPI003D71956B
MRFDDAIRAVNKQRNGIFGELFLPNDRVFSYARDFELSIDRVLQRREFAGFYELALSETPTLLRKDLICLAEGLTFTTNCSVDMISEILELNEPIKTLGILQNIDNLDELSISSEFVSKTIATRCSKVLSSCLKKTEMVIRTYSECSSQLNEWGRHLFVLDHNREDKKTRVKPASYKSEKAFSIDRCLIDCTSLLLDFKRVEEQSTIELFKFMDENYDPRVDMTKSPLEILNAAMDSNFKPKYFKDRLDDFYSLNEKVAKVLTEDYFRDALNHLDYILYK